MMQKLIRGERRLSLLGVGMGLAVLLVGGAVIATVFYAIHTANTSNKRAQQANTELERLRQVITSRCQTRVGYDTRFVEMMKGDIKTYQDSLSNARASLSNPLVADDPRLKAGVLESIRILSNGIATKQKIVAGGVIGNCSVYTQH